jgi:hypothetical protein
LLTVLNGVTVIEHKGNKQATTRQSQDNHATWRAAHWTRTNAHAIEVSEAVEVGRSRTRLPLKITAVPALDSTVAFDPPNSSFTTEGSDLGLIHWQFLCESIDSKAP